MKVALRIAGIAGIVCEQEPNASVGQYVESFDADAFDGRGDLKTTRDPSRALTFPNMIAAVNFWRTQSSVQPYRPDGVANRPLTAFHVEIEIVA